MCGRFTLSTRPEILAELFDLAEIPPLAPRYNVAPTQPVPVVLRTERGGPSTLRLFRWGLIPSGAVDAAVGNRMINARAETVATRPSFRIAFRKRRCLVPADGFYEWQKTQRSKQPFLIRMADGRPFAFAGLWEHWEPPEGDPAIDSCTILTTEPNDLVRSLHDRMPAIVRPKDYGRWLDPGEDRPEALMGILAPFPQEGMEAYAVGTQVNNARFDAPSCIEPQS